MKQRFSAGVAVAALALSWTVRIDGVPAAGQARTSPTAIDLKKLDAIEPLVRQEIEQRRLPGAVVLIGLGDRVVYQKAIGNRAQVPSREPMTLDTIFDLASLTKVVATTTSVMMLIEQGKLRLVDRVSTFIPGFERYGKADITIRHLLTHVSGLRPDVDLGDNWVGTDTAIQLADRGSADRAAGCPVRLQRHQFLPARGDRPPHQRRAARRVHAEADLQAAGDERHDVQPAEDARGPDCPDRELHAVRLAVRRAGHEDAARRRPRSDRAEDGRRRRACRVVQHGGRSGGLLPDAPERRQLSRRFGCCRRSPSRR